MAYDCQATERPAQPTLSIRARIKVQDLRQTLGHAFGAVAQYLGELGEQPAGAPFSAYYNMDMQNLDVEAGFPVAKPLAGKGEIQSGEIPAGLQASVVHIGPYSTCERAYAALTEWMKEQGHEPTGVAYEIYLSDPAVTPPEQLVTQIIFPVQPAPVQVQ